MRDLRAEAISFAPDGGLARVRECAAAYKAASTWAAWVVHVKARDARAGRHVVTLIHRNGTLFV
jgi:hypothetical protein